MKLFILSKLSFGIGILMAVHCKGIVLCCLLKCGEEGSEGRDWSERLGLFTASILHIQNFRLAESSLCHGCFLLAPVPREFCGGAKNTLCVLVERGI